jgi:hypothetical protein
VPRSRECGCVVYSDIVTLRRRTLFAACLVAFALHSKAARASNAEDEAAARALFTQGRSLAAAGKYNEACPKFEESARLFAGIGTRFNLADCYEHTGRLASAWAEFSNAAAAARLNGETDRERVARARATALEPRLSKLRIEVADDAKVDGLVVHRNGVVMGVPQWGVPVPIDAGTYDLDASAPNHATWHSQIVIAKEGETSSVSVPRLADGPGAALPPEEKRSTPREEPSANFWNGERIAATAIGVGAVAGIALGSIFGLASISKKNDVHNDCDATNHCDPTGVAIKADAVSDGTRSTIFYAAGVVLAVGSGFVFWHASNGSSSTRASAFIAPGIARVGVETSW